MKNDRRSFIKQTASAAAVAGAGSRARASSKNLDRPNILIVLDDQERQAMHTPPLSLPNRDQLREQGVEFSHSFCSYPLCSPSRATIMTGQWPHQVGVMTNVDFAAKNPSLPRDVPNIGRVFSDAGYRTVHFGKWHLSRRPHSVGNLFRYGFDEPRTSNGLYAIGSDPKVTRNAARWIESNSRKSPWLMVYSPINPHDICFPFLDEVYKFDRDYPVELPPNFTPTRAPDITSLQGLEHGYKIVEDMQPSGDDVEFWLRYLRFYCGLIEDVDVNLGVVLDALQSSGQWDNTVIVFTSDHGEMGGSHGLTHKGPTMYEENLRVPLIISDPRRLDGRRRHDGLVSHLDLVPTLCCLGGVEWPERLQGVDLSPILDGADEALRERVFAEGSPLGIPAWRGVRTDAWKYWHYVNGEELLYHLAVDPHETNNLASDPEAADLLVKFREQTRAWRRETDDPVREFMG